MTCVPESTRLVAFATTGFRNFFSKKDLEDAFEPATRVHACTWWTDSLKIVRRRRPLTPALSPQYRGEGRMCDPPFWASRTTSVPAHRDLPCRQPWESAPRSLRIGPRQHKALRTNRHSARTGFDGHPAAPCRSGPRSIVYARPPFPDYAMTFGVDC